MGPTIFMEVYTLYMTSHPRFMTPQHSIQFIIRYDLNQIPYNYTVEVTNRSKGLDLIECQKNCGQRFVTLYRRQGSRPSPRKKCKKAKWLSEESYK